MVTVTGDGTKRGHSFSVLKVKFILRPRKGLDVNNRPDMSSIHKMLTTWLTEKCKDKAQQSMFMQDDYKVEITVKA